MTERSKKSKFWILGLTSKTIPRRSTSLTSFGMFQTQTLLLITSMMTIAITPMLEVLAISGNTLNTPRSAWISYRNTKLILAMFLSPCRDQ